MLNAKGAELHGTLQEDLLDLPYEPTSMEGDVDQQDAEYQVAGNAILRSLGLGTARVLSGDVKGTQSKIYKRLKERQEAQERAAELRTGEPQDLSGVQAEPVMDFVDPQDALADAPAPTAAPQPASQPTAQPGAAIVEEASDDIDILDRPGSLVSEQQDEYAHYQSLGDDALDRIMEGRMQQPDIKDGILGGIRVTGTQPGMEVKIPDEGSVRGLIGSIAKELTVNPANARQISLDETQELADLIGSNPKRLTEMLKRGFNIDPNNPGALAAHVSAAKNLFFTEAKKLDELADAAAGPNATLPQKLAWKQQADLVANLQAMYKGAQTDIARALNAMKLPARNTTGMSPEDAAAIAGRDYQKLADDIGGVGALDEAIESYRKAPELMDRLEVIKGFNPARKFFNAWHEVWINGILSGPWTHVKNMAGGFAAIWNDNANTAAVAAMQGVTRGVFGMKGGVRDVTFGDLQAKMFGQIMSTQEALSAAGKGFRTREELFGSSKLESQVRQSDGSKAVTAHLDAFSAEAFGMREGLSAGHAVNVLGNVLTLGRAPTRLLVAEDAFIKVVAYRGALYELAYRDARLSGKQGDAFAEHVADFVFDPPGRATEEAQELARRTTLQQELDAKTKNVHKALSGPYLRWIVPFFKTPTNALFYVRDRSPFAPLFKPYKDAIAQGGAAAAKAKMQWQLGSAVFGTIAWFSDQDMITGGIDPDARVRAAYERRGIKPYSIRVPGTDTWIPYNTAEPISTIIGLAVDVAETMKAGVNKDDVTMLEAAFGAIAMIGNNLINKSFMVGVSKFIDAAKDPGKKLNSFLMNYATSATVPYSSLVNEIAKLQDDTQRFRRKTGIGMLQQIGTGIQTKLPYAQNSVLPARDAWGRLRSRSRFGAYDPNPVDEEIARLRLAYAPYPENESANIVYTDEQLDFFHRETGEMAFKQIQKFMKTDAFKRLQKGSKAGNVDATDELRLAIRQIRQGAIKHGRAMVRKHPKFGPELSEVDEANREFYQERQRQFEKDTAQ